MLPREILNSECVGIVKQKPASVREPWLCSATQSGNPDVSIGFLVMLVVPSACEGTSAEDAVGMSANCVVHVSCRFEMTTHNF